MGFKSLVPSIGPRRLITACLAAAALALAACGDDDERGTVEQSGGSTSTTGAETTGTPTTTSGSEQPTGDPVATIEVEETEYELNPANPGVESAGLVKFEVTNAGKIGHALEVEGPDGEVETEEIAPGDTAMIEADLNKPGSYRWYCPIGDHADQGMDGQILVAGGGSGGESSEEENDAPGSSGGY